MLRHERRCDLAEVARAARARRDGVALATYADDARQEAYEALIEAARAPGRCCAPSLRS
ncbi:hypothetical protein ACIA98_17250 [Streptomyces sp. NPDC051366]|uniref:hypothetical protein n=1 Tax=Streptomyces sp. NPDC051366 TaxID=3365652 RepID=UPI00379FCDD0